MDDTTDVMNGKNIHVTAKESFVSNFKTGNMNNVTQTTPNQKARISNVDAHYKKNGNVFKTCLRKHNDKLLFGIFYCSRLFLNAYVALMAPFFPQLAASRGVTQTMIGLVFSCYEFATLITAPFIGLMMRYIGPKFLYVTGLFVAGCCSVLFGFVDRSPPGASYIGLCIAIRSVEGISASCVMPVGQAIFTSTHPDKIASVTAYGAMFDALGVTFGPLIGAALYELGGFELPFLSAGILVILLGCATFFILPSTQDSFDPQHLKPESEVSYLTLLRNPYVIIMISFGFFESLMFSFINSTLGVYLAKQFNAGPSTSSLVFLGMAVCFALLCPLMARFIDKKINMTPVLLVIGASTIAVAHMFVGPAPFIPLSKTMWMTIISAVICGAGMSLSVIVFPAIIDAIQRQGVKANIYINGLVLSIRFTISKAGSLTGPLLGGALTENFGFPTAATVIGFLMLPTPFCMALYQIWIYCSSRKKEKLSTTSTQQEESVPLLKDVEHPVSTSAQN